MTVSEEMKFFIYLLENYAFYKNTSADKVLRQWDEQGISQKIFDNYLLYHSERIENAYEDIDSLMQKGEHAW